MRAGVGAALAGAAVTAAIACGSSDPAAAGAPRESGGSEAGVTTVDEVDLSRYAGRWYEIARLPNRFQRQCVSDVTAEYALRDDGRIRVVNRCRTSSGEIEESEGVAKVVDRESGARLKVRFAPAWLSFLPAVWGDYWILDLAPDYSHAVVGEPGREYLWVLARTPHLDERTYRDILDRIDAQGYDSGPLVRTRHHAGPAGRP